MTEIAKSSNTEVSQLAYDPSHEITVEDIALPKLKIAQGNHSHVTEGQVKFGSIFTSMSADDPDPQTLSDGKTPVRFYVFDLRKGKSYTDADNELQVFRFDDPDAPSDAWTTYTYTIAIPEHDQELPHTMLMTKSGKRAAQQLNLSLKKASADGPPHLVAFELTSARRENSEKGHKWYIPQVQRSTASAKDLAADRAVVESLVEMAAPSAQYAPSTDETSAAPSLS